jgi:hypothetical protein
LKKRQKNQRDFCGLTDRAVRADRLRIATFTP